jgi:hypothetical protein
MSPTSHDRYDSPPLSDTSPHTTLRMSNWMTPATRMGDSAPPNKPVRFLDQDFRGQIRTGLLPSFSTSFPIVARNSPQGAYPSWPAHHVLFGEEPGILRPLLEMIMVSAFDADGTIPQVSGTDSANSHTSRKLIWHPRRTKLRVCSQEVATSRLPSRHSPVSSFPGALGGPTARRAGGSVITHSLF